MMGLSPALFTSIDSASRGSAHGYRPDIDGLRALAVVPVVFFHAGIKGFSGGYIGVDVFFVISGYLITNLIHTEIESGRFSLIHFYERRARRILPALFAVMAASSIAGWVLMMPLALESFAESLFATTFFSANVYFLQSVDYFSTSAEFRLLLHTWSLAVEEQFYALWPLFLIGCAKFSWRFLPLGTVLIFAISLYGSIFYTSSYPEASFYLLPTRAWELLMGAILALGLVPRWRQQHFSETAAIIGILMLVAPMGIYDKTTTFPGTAALLPCLGTFLVVHSGGDTAIGRALAQRPIVFLGLISYSLYLWHWPVLASLRIVYGTVELPLGAALFATIASILIATFSWRFVEQPFRKRDVVGRGVILALSGASIAAVVTIGLIIVAADGLPSRLSGQASEIARSGEDIQEHRRFCIHRLPEDGLCRIGKTDEAPTVLLWGDSHANAIKSAIDRALRSADLSGIMGSHSACAPLLGVRRIAYDWKSCARFNDALLEMVEFEDSRIDTVILVARWALNVTGQRASGEAGARVTLVDMDGSRSSENRDLVRRGLAALVDRLRRADVRVVLLGGVPEIGWVVPTTIVARLRLGLQLPATPTLTKVQERNREADAILKRIAEASSVDFVPIAPLLCRPRCSVTDAGGAIYIDGDHLSFHGARDVLGAKLLGRLWPTVLGTEETIDGPAYEKVPLYDPS